MARRNSSYYWNEGFNYYPDYDDDRLNDDRFFYDDDYDNIHPTDRGRGRGNFSPRSPRFSSRGNSFQSTSAPHKSTKPVAEKPTFKEEIKQAGEEGDKKKSEPVRLNNKLPQISKDNKLKENAPEGSSSFLDATARKDQLAPKTAPGSTKLNALEHSPRQDGLKPGSISDAANPSNQTASDTLKNQSEGYAPKQEPASVASTPGSMKAMNKTVPKCDGSKPSTLHTVQKQGSASASSTADSIKPTNETVSKSVELKQNTMEIAPKQIVSSTTTMSQSISEKLQNNLEPTVKPALTNETSHRVIFTFCNKTNYKVPLTANEMLRSIRYNQTRQPTPKNDKWSVIDFDPITLILTAEIDNESMKLIQKNNMVCYIAQEKFQSYIYRKLICQIAKKVIVPAAANPKRMVHMWCASGALRSIETLSSHTFLTSMSKNNSKISTTSWQVVQFIDGSEKKVFIIAMDEEDTRSLNGYISFQHSQRSIKLDFSVLAIIVEFHYKSARDITLHVLKAGVLNGNEFPGYLEFVDFSSTMAYVIVDIATAKYIQSQSMTCNCRLPSGGVLFVKCKFLNDAHFDNLKQETITISEESTFNISMRLSARCIPSAKSNELTDLYDAIIKHLRIRYPVLRNINCTLRKATVVKTEIQMELFVDGSFYSFIKTKKNSLYCTIDNSTFSLDFTESPSNQCTARDFVANSPNVPPENSTDHKHSSKRSKLEIKEQLNASISHAHASTTASIAKLAENNLNVTQPQKLTGCSAGKSRQLQDISVTEQQPIACTPLQLQSSKSTDKHSKPTDSITNQSVNATTNSVVPAPSVVNSNEKLFNVDLTVPKRHENNESQNSSDCLTADNYTSKQGFLSTHSSKPHKQLTVPSNTAPLISAEENNQEDKTKTTKELKKNMAGPSTRSMADKLALTPMDGYVSLSSAEFPDKTLKSKSIKLLVVYLRGCTAKLQNIGLDAPKIAASDGVLTLQFQNASGLAWVENNLDALQKIASIPLAIVNKRLYRAAIWIKNFELKSADMPAIDILNRVKDAIPDFKKQNCKIIIEKVMRGSITTTLVLYMDFSAMCIMSRINYIWNLGKDSNIVFSSLFDK